MKITNSQIESLKISKTEMLDWVDNAIKLKNEMLLPAKISMKPSGHIFYNVMPAIIPQLNIAGVKVVNRYPENTPCLKSEIMLYDYKNGDFLSLLDGEYITTQRTGAVAVHSINLFARKDFRVVAFIGLGSVTKACFSFFVAIYGDRKLQIKLFKYKNHAENLITEFANKTNFEFEIVDNYINLMKDSDIIVSGVTYMENDFCDEKFYKKGVTIIPIHTRGFKNCDKVFDKVFCDDIAHVRGFEFFNEFKSINEVTSVLNNKACGRENNEERILCYNIGIAIHDMCFAKHIYDKFNLK